MAATNRDPVDVFKHYDADEINTFGPGVSGWVPKQNVEPLMNELPETAWLQMWTDDEHEAFITSE